MELSFGTVVIVVEMAGCSCEVFVGVAVNSLFERLAVKP